MQIVLSGNRIIAHGTGFVPMGGTVINAETGKAYQNATVAECDGCPSDIDSVGYEYHAGVFVPCAPYGKDNGSGEIIVACEDCATPKTSGKKISDFAPAKWTELGTVTDGNPLSVDLDQYNEILCMCDAQGNNYESCGFSFVVVPDTLKKDGISYIGMAYSDKVRGTLAFANKSTITNYIVEYAGATTTGYTWYIYGR